MKGIENITAKIQADAQAEIDALENETLLRCEAIQEKAEASARDAYWEVMRQGAENSAQRRERAHSLAAMEVKKQVLSEKQALVEQAFDMAYERLRALPEEDYVAFLAKLMADAAAGGEKAIFSPADRAHVGKKAVQAANRLLEEQGKSAGLTLSEQTREIRGGVILERGRVEANCSFEALVEYSRNELMGEVAAILFN